MTGEIYAGLMSGTSLDGVDAVLADFKGGRPRLFADAHLAFDAESDGAWLLPLWQEWRARYEITERALLRALAKGIQARGSGWMSKRIVFGWRLPLSAINCASSVC